MELVGREPQRRALRHLLEGARAGRGAALVVRADAGMGKTSLIDDAIDAATDLQVTRFEGVESEMELPYAGLHRLLLPVLDDVDQLPDRQRTAMRSAFGVGGLDLSDRFAVGLATLSLLDRAAARTPLLCAIDDVQWVDRESLEALALVARRLDAERIAMLFAGRDIPDVGASLDGIPELRLGGLDDADATALVRRVVDGHLHATIVHRIVAETAGTPLAIIELANELEAEQLSVRGLAPEPLPVGRRLEAHFLRQVRELPQPTQDFLLVAASDPTQDVSVVARAAERLGLATIVVEPAIDRGFFGSKGPPSFRHPLIRSAIYSGAPSSARRRVHAALADATDPPKDADRRAWHRAAATIGLDEEVAAELEAAAARARLRGGHSTAGLFLARAAELTPDHDRRADRTLAAADSHLTGGAPSRARALLDAADLGAGDGRRHAEAMRIGGAIRYAVGDMPHAVTELIRAAKAMAACDVAAARTTLLLAASASRFAGRFARPGSRDVDVASAARQLPLPVGTDATAPHLLLDAYAALHLDGIAVAMPVLQQALSALTTADGDTEESLLSLGIGAWVASAVADDGALHALATRMVSSAREQGAVVHLADGLLYSAMSHLLGGSLRGAQADFAERAELLATLGVSIDVGPMVVAAWAGRGDEARSAATAVRAYAVEHELGWMLVFADYATAVLEIGLGNYHAALAGVDQTYEDDSFLAVVAYPNVIEALVRSGRIAEARAAHATFTGRATSMGGAMSLGLLERSTALLADDEAAEAHHLRALDLLQRSRAELQIGRAHLLYGEWLRRRKRLTDARLHLRCAHESFVERGLGAFAERARIELEAAGERVQRLPASTIASLTPQEGEIARLAADGRTNQEIAAKLFLSASTVDYHLRKVYRKLAIPSRRRLRDVLP